MGVDQNRSHSFLPGAGVEICQGAVTASIAKHCLVIHQSFCTSPAPIAVGHQGGLIDAESLQMAGQGRIHRCAGIQSQPTALPSSSGSRGVEAGDLQPTPLQQPGIGGVGGIPHDLLADETVKVAAVAIASGIHLERTARRSAKGHGFMAETPQPAVLHGGLLRICGVDFHQPSVFVARQAEWIAKPGETIPIAAEGSL